MNNLNKNLQNKDQQINFQNQEINKKNEQINSQHQVIQQKDKEINNQKLTIQNKDKELQKQNQQINNQQQVIQQKDKEFNNQKLIIQNKDKELQKQNQQINSQNQVIQNINQEINNQKLIIQNKNQEIQKQNQQINNQNLIIQSKDQEIQKQKEMQNQKDAYYQKQIQNEKKNSEVLNEQIKKLQEENNNLKKNSNVVPPKPPKPPKPIIPDYKYPTLIGLQNIGSTCYMNATLQCFSQTAPFTEYFLNPKNKDIILKGKFNDAKNLRLAKAYYEVVINLWKKSFDPNYQKYYEPKNFKFVLGSLNELFKKMEASDAKDMIVFFLEQIHKEINLIKPPDNSVPKQIPDQYNRDNMLKHFINEFQLNNKSIISDNFFIVSETTQKCQNCQRMNTPNSICYNYNIQNVFIFPLEEVRKYRDNIENGKLIQNMNQMMMPNMMNPMMQNMMNPMMPNMMNPMMQNMMNPMMQNMMNPMMPNTINPMMTNNNQNMMPNMGTNNPYVNTNTVTLYDCFNFNQKDDLMCGENQIYCNKCKQSSDSIYGNKILTLPNILIMILNRGKDNMYKITIDFQKDINLTSYLLNSNNEQYIYSIYGVITHLGESGEGGHFIAACKSPVDNKWYRYNDAIVTEITNYDKEVVQFPTPYILFYQRKK